ncbi:MAG: iron uptake porin, partial [Cyanobacteria bacterium J06642_3]
VSRQRRIVWLGIIAINSLLTSSTSLANSLESITSVQQLKKLETIDPNYQDIQYLARRYNCLTNFRDSNNTKAVTRYQLAIAISNCWQKLENSKDFQDVVIWRQLKQNFALELSQLSNKVNQVEADLAQLESQQFSTTTKVQGQVLFFIADSFSTSDDSEAFTGYRTRLDFNTSFTGQDQLQVRFESRDIGRLDDVTDTPLTRLSVDGSTESTVEIGELSYSFTPREGTIVVLGTSGVGLNDIGEVLNPFSSSSKGALSRFGRRNPATLRGSGGAGFGIIQEFNNQMSASFGYLIDNESAASPEAGRGIFDSSFSAISQFVIEPQESLTFALTYTHTYQLGDDVNLMGSTGSEDSNEPFEDNATTSDNFGLQVNWELTSNIEIGGWFGYSQANQQEGGNERATILNGALTFAVSDLFAEGNRGGIIIGVPPTISGHDDSSLIAESTPLHIEALYQMELSDRIEITPGAFAIINPDTDDGNTIWVTTVRTLFSF